MTKCRNKSGGGGALKAPCADCTGWLYEGCESLSSFLPISGWRSVLHRASWKSRNFLAWYKLGTDNRLFHSRSGWFTCARKYGRQLDAHADKRRNAEPLTYLGDTEQVRTNPVLGCLDMAGKLYAGCKSAQNKYGIYYKHGRRPGHGHYKQVPLCLHLEAYRIIPAKGVVA